MLHCTMDCLFMILLGLSWLEKRSLDQSRNGFFWARGCVALLIIGIPAAIYDSIVSNTINHRDDEKLKSEDSTQNSHQIALEKSLTIIIKLLLAIMLVTGPATGSSVFIVAIQGWMLFILGGATGFYEVSDRHVVRSTFDRLRDLRSFPLCILGLPICTSDVMAFPCQTYFLCDQSWLCIQSSSIFIGFRVYCWIRLCVGWNATVFEHFWLGDSWPGRG